MDLSYTRYRRLMNKLAPAFNQKGSGRRRRRRGGAILPFVPPNPYMPKYKTLPFMMKI